MKFSFRILSPLKNAFCQGCWLFDLKMNMQALGNRDFSLQPIFANMKNEQKSTEVVQDSCFQDMIFVLIEYESGTAKK